MRPEDFDLPEVGSEDTFDLSGEQFAVGVLACPDAATTGPEGLRKHSLRFFVDELGEVLNVKFCETGMPPVE